MPWQLYATCGFDKAVTWSTLTYSAVVEFSYKEVDIVGSPTNTRILSNLFNLNIQISRQKDITASLALDVADPTSTSVPVVSAYIVGGSSYDLLSGKTRVLVQTHTAWPYQVASPLSTPVSTGPVSTSSPTNTIVEINPDYFSVDNCQPSSYCIQQFEVIISADPGAATPLCDFFGDYVFSTQLVCSDIDTCTPIAGPSITISLDHTNTCAPPELNATTGVEQSLVAFSAADFAGPTTVFETGDTSYWAFAVVDPNVSIDSVTLNSVTLRMVGGSGGQDIVLANNVAATALVNRNDATAGVYPPGSKAVVSFGLQLNRASLPNTIGQLNPGDIQALELVVVVDIVQHGNKKRVVGVVPTNGGTAQSSSKFVVKAKGMAAPKPHSESAKGSNCTGSRFTCTIISAAQKMKGVLGF
jgi:hypothetical protein